MKPCKHQRNKQRGQDLGWKAHGRAHLLVLRSYTFVIAMFLLVSCMNLRNHLLHFVGSCSWSTSKNSEQKTTKKNFAGLHNHFPLLSTV